MSTVVTSASRDLDRPVSTGSSSARCTLVGAGVAGLVVLGAAALPYLFGPYEQQVGYRILQLGTLASAWNLVAGYGGMVSLGSAAFVGVGAYAAAEVGNRAGLPLPALLLFAAAAAAGFAVLVSPAMFRLRGLYFTVGTLALAEALRIFMVNSSVFGGAGGILVRSVSPPPYALYWWALGLGVLATAAVSVVMASPLALSLRGVRDDEDTARQMGLVTFRTKLWASAISAALIGMVGGLQSVKLGVIEPYGAFGLPWTVDTVTVAIIGGLGTRLGPWIGAVAVAVLAEALASYPEAHLAITGVVVLAVIRLAPHGIWGTAAAWYAARRGRR